MGAALTQARIDLVRRHFDGQVVDIGIGGGRFVTESGAMGFDVNPEAVDWLKAQERYYDPYQHHAEAVTCWDSLEHIPEPEKLLDHVGEWLFVSMPIYKDQADCLASKHCCRANIAGIGASLVWLPVRAAGLRTGGNERGGIRSRPRRDH